MNLYLVRHGESLSSDIDPEQPLSDVGRQETESVASFLKKGNLEIDEIQHSVKLRAKQTAEILGSYLNPEIKLLEKNGIKPMDPIEPIVKEIHSLEQNLMLVGHLPFMEKLLTFLLYKQEAHSPVILSGSCVVCLSGGATEWRISWVVSPQLTFPSKIRTTH